MQKLFEKVKIILLVILFLGLMAGLTYWMFVTHNLWIAVSVDCGILAVLFAVLAIRSYMMRRKESQFINRIIDQDNAKPPLGADAKRQQILELQNNWKESVNRLQNSTLRKKGNPLYVLPWYVIVGETGSGKTTAILNSGRCTSLSEVAPSREIHATKNCDWYFFENSVILDTAGRYAIPCNEAFDLDEWRNLLVLLSQYRKKEPINGLIVTVAADALLSDNEEQLQEKAKIIRPRINHMMRTLGTKFPVYVLVTKMDCLFGFDDFSRNLDQKALDEAMGFINNAEKLFWHDVFTEAIHNIEKRLYQFRRQSVLKTEKVSSKLLFPVEFNSLSEKVEAFIEPLFADNSYQTTPLFRGIFFSCAFSQEHAISEFLKITGYSENDVFKKKHPLKSIYLKDFFSRILPGDRKQYSFLEEFNVWKKITASLALSSWMLLIFLIGGLMGYSYLGNLSVINRFAEVYATIPLLANKLQDDLVIMEKFRQEVLDLEKQNNTLHIPRPVGFGKRRAIEKKVKNIYCKLFEERFLNPIDESLNNITNHKNLTINHTERADVVGYLVLRILSLKNGDQALNKKEFIPLASGVIQFIYPDQQDNADLFAHNYYSYLLWTHQVRDKEELKNTNKVMIERLQKYLVNQLMDETNINMAWLINLKNLNNDDIRLSTFWSNFTGDKNRDSIILRGAYTQNGRQEIERFISSLQKALDDENPENRSETDIQKETLESNRKQFWDWYKNNFFKAWYDAIVETENGTALFSTLDEKRLNAISMTGSDNPYFKALDVSAHELNAYGNATSRPAWVSQLLYASRLRSFSLKAEFADDRKKSAINFSFFDTMNKKQSKAVVDTLTEARAWKKYANDLQSLPISSMNSKQMADAYSACFIYSQNNIDPSKSPFLNIYASISSLKKTLKISSSQIENQEPVPVLLYGPLNYLLIYAGDSTGEYLQKTWSESVVAPSVRTNPAKKAHQLFNYNDGLVWKFIEGPAFPFLYDTTEGFQARSDIMNNVIQFTDDFLSFLDKGAILPQNIQPYYGVTIKTIPTRANNDARVQPISVRLDVASTENPFILNNFNYPQTAVFKWNPDTCSTTTLTIAFPGFFVQKIYDGALGFAHFLDDFRYEKHVFTNDDFPDKKAWLDSNKISSITVTYQIDGKIPVLKLLNETPEVVPAEIIDTSENR